MPKKLTQKQVLEDMGYDHEYMKKLLKENNPRFRSDDEQTVRKNFVKHMNELVGDLTIDQYRMKMGLDKVDRSKEDKEWKQRIAAKAEQSSPEREPQQPSFFSKKGRKSHYRDTMLKIAAAKRDKTESYWVDSPFEFIEEESKSRLPDPSAFFDDDDD